MSGPPRRRGAGSEPPAGHPQAKPDAPPEAGRRPAQLGNWREAPGNRWAFHHVRELIPTENVPGAPDAVAALPDAPRALLELAFEGPAGRSWTLAGMLVETHTDALLVLHEGRIALEWYAGHYRAHHPHIVFSVSKSITGLLAGILAGRGVLDPDAPVLRYLPEAGSSAYAECSVRHLLDMTVSVDFEESYLDRSGSFARYRVATGWNPVGAHTPQPDLRSFLLGLPRAAHPHGQRFQYKSPNSDLLGWVVERAAGERYASLLSRLLWQPIGAEADAYVTVDHLGAARAAGGICARLRDLGRLGEMLRNEGRSGAREVVPAAWLRDTVENGDRQAWRLGGFGFLPEGSYRNQWYQSGNPHRALFAVGIHGQWIYVDPVAAVVIVKLSSQPEPVDDALDAAMLRAFDALARAC